MNILKKSLHYVPKLFFRMPARFSNASQYNVAEIEDDSNVTTRDKLLHPLTDLPSTGGNKVTIIGSGNVGTACAFCILAQKVSNEICLVGRNEKKVIAEMLNMQDGSVFLGSAKISAGADYCISADSRVGIITSGANLKPGQTRLSLTKTNAEVMKDIIPKFIETSPNSIILMVTNPVDILTYVAWKVSGFPTNRVLGSGTTLDAARFRFLLSQRLNVAPSSCQGLIIGDRGGSSVPLWSGVNISGVRLGEMNSCNGLNEDPQNINQLHREVKRAGYEVFKRKGYTNWGIALSCAAITDAILNNHNTVFPVSICVKGLFGIDKEVFLSLPCVINANGATAVVKQRLDDLEIEQLQASAEIVHKVQASLNI